MGGVANSLKHGLLERIFFTLFISDSGGGMCVYKKTISRLKLRGL